ncbi:unnamed protein product, partial [Candidula unifasciata]
RKIGKSSNFKNSWCLDLDRHQIPSPGSGLQDLQSPGHVGCPAGLVLGENHHKKQMY